MPRGLVVTLWMVLFLKICHSFNRMGGELSKLTTSTSSRAAVMSTLATASNHNSNSNSVASVSASGDIDSSAGQRALLPLSAVDRGKAALFGLYVADAVAMPVHWMYDLRNLRRDYGRIEGYVKPKDHFEGSILNLSNTGGGGRGGFKGNIVGDVILHGKKKYWVRGGNYHYHLGLEAGENTLEAQLCKQLVLSMTETEKGEFSAPSFLQRYLRFMQTPGTHNDTYASTCHRMFFANLMRGVPPEQCADNDGHNTDAIDALTLTVPVVLRYAASPREVMLAKVNEVIAVTRKSRVLQKYAATYADILVSVLQGEPLRDAVERHAVANPAIGSVRRLVEQQSRGRDPMVACYIDSAFPAMLIFAYKYADSFEEAVLASANAGGENVARGALLGALMGAAHGLEAIPEWAREGLKDSETVMRDISAFVGSCSPNNC